MQEAGSISNTTAYIKKYAVTLDNLNTLVKYMVSPSAREIIQQFFSNYDENACLSIFAYPTNVYELLGGRSQLMGMTYGPVHFLSSETEAYGYTIPSYYYANRHKLCSFELTRRHKNYLDYAPYTKMQLYLPCVGTVDIDPAAWYDKTIDFYYIVDFENGGITYFAEDPERGIDIGKWSGQYGVEIAVTSTRLGEVKTQAVTGTISGAVEMLTGNLAGGAMQSASSAASWFTSPAGVSGGRAGQGIANTLDASDPYIIETYFDPVEDDEAFASVHGLPLYAKRDFSDLAGYTVIDDVHLEGFGTATEGELQEIESLLKSGVHF